MQVSKQQLQLLVWALNHDPQPAMTMAGPQPQPRRFAFSDLSIVNALAAKLLAGVRDGAAIADVTPLSFTTDEKKFLKDTMQSHKWQAGDAEHVIAIVDMLNAPDKPAAIVVPDAKPRVAESRPVARDDD